MLSARKVDIGLMAPFLIVEPAVGPSFLNIDTGLQLRFISGLMDRDDAKKAEVAEWRLDVLFSNAGSTPFGFHRVAT